MAASFSLGVSVRSGWISRFDDAVGVVELKTLPPLIIMSPELRAQFNCIGGARGLSALPGHTRWWQTG